MNINIENILNLGKDLIWSITPTLLGAIAVLVVGWFVIGWADKAIRHFFEKVDFDEALETFIASFAVMALRVILLVIVVGMLGVQTTSLIALLGAAGLAVGLALQGSLANFAGGVLILVFKPFKVGDYIEAQGAGGKVKEIQIFNTILYTLSNQKVILPNGNLSNDVVVNVTTSGKRRHDLIVGIGYSDNIPKAKEIILAMLKSEEKVMQTPEPTVGVSGLGDSAVELQVRFWAHNDDFLAMKYWFLEEVKAQYDKAGISIPFPQRDVHLYNQ